MDRQVKQYRDVRVASWLFRELSDFCYQQNRNLPLAVESAFIRFLEDEGHPVDLPEGFPRDYLGGEQ